MGFPRRVRVKKQSFLSLPHTSSSGVSRLPEIDESMRALSEILQQLGGQRSSIEEDIHATFEELQKTLNVRKSVLLMELEVTYGLKQKVRFCRSAGCSWEIQL